MKVHISKKIFPEDFILKSKLPSWFALTLTTLFAILWSVWLLPHTVFVRHSCMVIGCILGLYICLKNHHLFFRKSALPIYGIALLFLWISFHLFFIGQAKAEQLDEYLGVWKKVFLCAPFALGMGFALAQSKKIATCWKIFYIGLSAPVLIYFCKLVITQNAGEWGVSSPFLLLDSDHTQSRFGISRALYTFYCIPGFATAIFQLLSNSHSRTKFDFLYIVSIIFTPSLFYLEGDRSGLLLVGLLLLAAFIKAIYLMRRGFNLKTLLIGSMLLAGVTLASLGFIRKFDHWKSVAATTKVALDIDTYDQWKYQGGKGYPKNELGEVVEGSNYERIAWWVAGSRLLLENPQGYGMLTLSFDRLTKKKWPDSRLSMTHSGWLDFALGYGIPGLLLLFTASFVSWGLGLGLPAPWNGFVIWGFGSLNLIFLFKELSNETCVNAFLFLILLIGSFSAAYYSRSAASKIS